MPVTQGIWTWDKFLHGGQDFELGLLLIITCLCLLLLRVEQNKMYLGTLLLIRARLLLDGKRAIVRVMFIPHSGHRPCTPPGTPATCVNLPLLI